MTPEEKRWVDRLRRVLREMPKSLEIQVHQNTISVSRAGARAEAFERDGHADSVAELAHFQTKRVYPCSESI